ncbi:MAG: hypothetical protein E6300_07230 [Clostridium sp.]|uniref:hypothetical protein n=1 Tax=Clostridium sp. TaxID=1506 RepID=UPI00290C59C5|nr:hypothetical protein [Clostridium sp.]MDU7148266.1 hypothetical protein [Clostridium sp.]MDU7240969.1 hypothetical protein [Clostridium sp.]
MWNKKKNTMFIINIILVCILMIGCSGSNNKAQIPNFVKTLQETIGYDVEYIEDRSIIRVTDYLSKDTIIDAVSKDNVYNQWVEMRNTFLGLYDGVEKLANSNGMKDINYEIIVIDKESANTDEEVPLLIINETGIVFDMVEEVKN